MLRKRWISIGLGAAVIVAAVLLTICLWPESPQNTQPVVRIGYLPITPALPEMVALDKGMFEAHGLKAEPVVFSTSELAVQALIAGNIHYTKLASASVYAVESRQPGLLTIQSVNAQTGNTDVDMILVRKDAGITSIADLAGRRIGAFPGAAMEAYLNVILRANGLAPDSLTIEPIAPPSQVDALISGRVHAIWTVEPIPTLMLSKPQVASQINVLEKNLMSRYVQNPTPAGSGIMLSSYINEYPDQAQAIHLAISEAIDFIQEHPQEARSILAKYTSLDQAQAQDVGLSRYYRLDQIDRKAMQQDAKILSENAKDFPSLSEPLRYYHPPSNQ